MESAENVETFPMSGIVVGADVGAGVIVGAEVVGADVGVSVLVGASVIVGAIVGFQSS